MQRVMIIGPSGAGKSWLARRLGERTGLPVVHLDQEYWQPGWVAMDNALWVARVADLTARERWILDGNYGGTIALRMGRADTIIFVDAPRWRAIIGVIERRLRYARHRRPDIPRGCPEELSFELLRWVWRYRHATRPRILAQLAAHREGRTIHVLRSRADVKRFIAKQRD